MYRLHRLHNYTPLYIDYTHEDSIQYRLLVYSLVRMEPGGCIDCIDCITIHHYTLTIHMKILYSIDC